MYDRVRLNLIIIDHQPDRNIGLVDIDAPVDNRPQFKRMVRSDLVLNGNEIGICCGAEIDAVKGDTAYELKTRQFKDRKVFGYHIAQSMILQMELAGVSNLVVGWKNDNYVVKSVEEYDITALKSDAKKGEEKCLTFLYDVLLLARNILTSKDVCEIKYDPAKGVVQFSDFPKEEAMNLLTPEFKKKFNLEE